MKILWVSANKFGFELLKILQTIHDVDVIGVVTLKKSAKTIMYDGIPNKKWYSLHKHIIEIDRLNDEYNLIKEIQPDLIIVCGWRQVINKNILNIPKYGTIGFHPTILPYGRGPAPIINTLLNGLTESGVSMFYLSNGIDNGDIIAQEKFIITNTDHSYDVYHKIIKAGKKLIKTYLPLVVNGRVTRVPQDNNKATQFDEPPSDIHKIDMQSETLEQIYRKIRALSKPYKGAYIEKGDKQLIIWQAELREVKR